MGLMSKWLLGDVPDTVLAEAMKMTPSSWCAWDDNTLPQAACSNLSWERAYRGSHQNIPGGLLQTLQI